MDANGEQLLDLGCVARPHDSTLSGIPVLMVRCSILRDSEIHHAQDARIHGPRPEAVHTMPLSPAWIQLGRVVAETLGGWKTATG